MVVSLPMRRKLFFLLFLLVTFFVTACSGGKAVSRTKSTPVHQTSVEYNYFFLEALRLQHKGDYAAAFDLLKLCIELDSLAPEAYYELGAYYPDLKNDSMANVCFERAVKLNPKNDFYHERLAQWYIQSKNYTKAIGAYEHLFENNRSRSDVLEILLQLYQQQKDYKKMLSTIDRIEQIEGNSEQITLSKMQVYQLQGDKESAFNSLKKLADDHPNDINYKVMMGNWLQQNGRLEEAKDIFIKAQQDEPNNEYIAASLYDFYRLQNEDSMANIYRDKILLNKYTATTTKLTMLQNLVQDNEKAGGDSTKVLQLMDKVLQADPKNADIAEYMASYISSKNMSESKQDSAYYRVLQIAPDRASARLQLIRLKWEKQDWVSIISLCKPALEYNPDQMAFCYFLGLGYYQQKDSAKALEAFRIGVSRINEKSDKDMVSDFYALMGDIKHEMGAKEEAYVAYDSCLQWKPDNVGCLNNYAYFLSVENGDLEKAASMSLKAITKEPNNATFLDTYAWILYCQEKYTEAKVFIDRTLENMDSTENNSTLYDHAGDIYKACGEVTKAVEYWREAIKAGSEEEAVITKKIRKYEK